MCAIEEAVSHRVHHRYETAERYGETQLILPHPRTGRRVEQAKEAPMASPLVLLHRHGNDIIGSNMSPKMIFLIIILCSSFAFTTLSND